MSSDAQQLATIIQQMSTPDSNVIRQAEENIKNAAAANPTVFIASLVQILQGDFDSKIKQQCCIWLKKAMSPYEDALPDLYDLMDNNAKASFRVEIFKCITCQTDAKVTSILGDTIGEIAGALVSDKRVETQGDPWPELLQQTFTLIDSNSENLIEAGLRLLNNIALYASFRYVPKLGSIKDKLQVCLEKGNTKIRIRAIEVVGSFVSTLPPKNVKGFLVFAVPVMKVANMLIFESNELDSGSKLLEIFADIVETEPKFFKANFGDLIELMGMIRSNPDVDIGVKNQCLEIVVSISQRYPEFLQKDSQLLTKIVEMIFKQMLEIPDEIGEEWINPPDGFKEEDEDLDESNIIKFCIGCIDRLISHVGPDKMLGFLSDCTQNMLGPDKDWKMKHAAFMALSQIGEYMRNKPEEIKPIVVKIGEYMGHENPRIRYACCHAIGQLADDLAPDFQILYHDQVLPMLAQRLKDPVPRVLGHACASLTNHFENCSNPKEQIEPFIKELMNELWQIVEKGSCFVREHALSAISSLSVGAGKEIFAPYYEQNMNILFMIIENANDPNLKKLRGHAIECASITSKSIGKEAFAKHCDRLVLLMIKIQENINSNIGEVEEDPQLGFLLSAWQRISGLMKEDFHPYLARVMPSLIEMCHTIVKIGKKYENDPNPLQSDNEPEVGKANKFSVFEDDNCLIAMNMISVFLKRCGSALADWAEQIYGVIVPLMGYLPNDNVRMIAAEALPNLLLSLQGVKSTEDIHKFAKMAGGMLWTSMDQEPEVEVLLTYAKSMQKLIEYAGEFLADEGLQQMYDKCVEHLKRSDERKNQTDEHRDEDGDEDIDGVLDAEKDSENEFHCQIAEIFGKLFMTHKERTIPIVRRLDEQFIITSLQDNQPPLIQKFGLFLIDDIIDNLGDIQEIRQVYFEKYYKLLTHFVCNNTVYVRHAAVYGIGAMASCLKADFFPLYEDALKNVYTAINLPKKEDDFTEFYNSFCDNAKSAFGKIIESVSDKLYETEKEKLVKFLREWLFMLPLKHDTLEGKIQINMLIRLLKNNYTIVANPTDIEAVKHTLYIIALVFSSKGCSDDIKIEMKNILNIWKSDAAMTATISQIQLEKGIQSQLQAIMEYSN